MDALFEGVLFEAAVVLLGLVAAGLLRRKSAAVRHWVLAASVLCAAAAPLLMQVVPAWHAPLSGRSSVTLAPPPPGALPQQVSVTDTVEVAATATAASPVASWSMPGLLVGLWLAGMAVVLFPLGAGWLRLVRIGAGAQPLADGSWREVAADLGAKLGLTRPVTLLESTVAASPVTWGYRRPRVLLPAGASGWDDARIRTVLAHELAHVRRGDWAVQIVAETLKAVHWFNPLVWAACRRLRQEGEYACDDAVLNEGIGESEYAEQLLEFARAQAREPRVPSPALAMARPSTLERRITAMLTRDLNRAPISGSARLAAGAALLLLTIATSGLALAQGFGAFSGTVYDATNRYVPGARLVLTDVGTQAKYEVRSDASGQFEFVVLPAAEYRFENLTPGFRTELGSLTMSGQKVQKNVTLQVGSLEESISVAAGGPSGVTGTPREKRPVPTADNCPVTTPAGGNIRPPRKVKDVRPAYPAHLVNVGGLVVLNTRIDKDGNVADAAVVGDANADLAAAAIDAVRQWEFDPTILNCDATDVWMKVTVRFNAQ